MWPRPLTLPFQSEPNAAPVRLIVRRVQPTPGSQLALFATYSYHGFITDRDGETLELEADHRRHAEIENAIRDLKYGVGLNHLPSGRFAANGAWLAVQVMAHNLARWTARIGLGEQIVTTRTLRRRLFLYHRTAHPLGTSPHFASAPALALGSPVQWRPGTAASHSTPSLTTRRQLARHPANRTSPQTRASPVRLRLFPCPISPSPASPPLQAAIGAPKSACRPPAEPPICPNGAQDISPVAPSPLFRCPHPVHRCPSVDSG